MDNQVKLNCPACGVEYNADATRLKHGRQTTCSRACSYKLRATKLQNGQEHKCGGCGDLFYRAPSHSDARHGALFCSKECAYANRKRIVEKPYNRVAVVDYKAASKKAWESRRRNPKPYPDSARQKAAARAVERIKAGGGVSKFELKAAEVFRSLGFKIQNGVPIRTRRGTFAHVFDILLPARRIVVECHGTYFHGGRWTWDNHTTTQAKNLGYEERKVATARSIGLEVRILWEHEFKKDPAGACLAVVR